MQAMILRKIKFPYNSFVGTSLWPIVHIPHAEVPRNQVIRDVNHQTAIIGRFPKAPMDQHDDSAGIVSFRDHQVTWHWATVENHWSEQTLLEWGDHRLLDNGDMTNNQHWDYAKSWWENSSNYKAWHPQKQTNTLALMHTCICILSTWLYYACI